MENNTNTQQRHKKKIKLRYDRIAMLVILAVVIVFGVVYGISAIITKGKGDNSSSSSNSSNTSSSSLAVVKPISSAGVNGSKPKNDTSSSSEDTVKVDAIASSSIKPISGKQLGSIIEKRVLAAEYNVNSKATEKPVTKPITTPPSVNPSTNLPADAGSVSSSSQSSSATSGSSSSANSSSASSSAPARPASSSSAAASSSVASATTPAKFDPATVGSSGATNIKKWKEINSDVRAWIKIPNTNINLPVVIGADNNYYSEKGYYKEANKNGVIWADSHVKFGDKTKISKNTVLYGHNWTNYLSNPRIGDSKDVMFGQLPAYDHLSFAQQTPYIHYSTEDETMLYKVFAVFYTETAFNYIACDAEPGGQLYIIEEAKRRSKFNFDVDVKSNDKILTLSTCTRVYGPSSDQRFVVMARLMRPDEEVKAVTVTDNPNHKKPTL